MTSTTMKKKLTKPQKELLLLVAGYGIRGIYTVESYKPSIALVSAGLCEWKRGSHLHLTAQGLHEVNGTYPLHVSA